MTLPEPGCCFLFDLKGSGQIRRLEEASIAPPIRQQDLDQG